MTKLCVDCRHVRKFALPSRILCARTESKPDKVTGEVEMRSCHAERSRLLMFTNRCGPSGRFFEPKPCGGPVQFNWSEPPPQRGD